MADRFASLIAGLEQSGMTRGEIAARTGLSKTTIWKLAEGMAREPGYMTIRRVERLHEEAVGPLPPLRFNR